MQYRRLGRTGLRVSEIGFGGWAIGGSWGKQDDNESLKALHAAVDAGVNFIDTAASYGDGKSERLIGKVLKDYEDKIFVATKTPPINGPWPPSPYCKASERYPEKYLRENVEERLRNLNVDCLDILQLHTWTRAWNNDPEPLDILKQLQYEGKIKYIGISTPEHDQNSVIDLMRRGYLDVVQVIYNIFEQEPSAELLPTAHAHNVGVIVRVAFDEGALTGKFTEDTTFPEDDFRQRYFAGDRLERTVKRVNTIQSEIEETEYSMPQTALKFSLSHPAVSTVIPGMRNVAQVEANTAVSDLPEFSADVLGKLQKHAWRRSFWYGGK